VLSSLSTLTVAITSITDQLKSFVECQASAIYVDGPTFVSHTAELLCCLRHVPFLLSPSIQTLG
jgi:hypothetical protein